jgi:hypothetical protein
MTWKRLKGLQFVWAATSATKKRIYIGRKKGTHQKPKKREK